MIDIEVFKCFSLTKRSRIALEEGEYLGDMRSGLGVYSLYDFWVIVDENVRKALGKKGAAMANKFINEDEAESFIEEERPKAEYSNHSPMRIANTGM